MLPSYTPCACTVRDTTGCPRSRVGASASNMERMMRGTPAMTCTLPMVKAGALVSSQRMGTAPRGSVAIRIRAALNSTGGFRLA